MSEVASNKHEYPTILIKLIAFLFCLSFHTWLRADESSRNVALNWGETQVRSLLQDRPQLQSVVVNKNKIWDWLVAAFGSTTEGIRVHWDGGPLSAGPYDAESHWLDENKNVYIKVGRLYRDGVSKGRDRNPEELLFSVVFELNNVKHRNENLSLRASAKEGSISRDAYIRGAAQCEYIASQETGTFYREIWTPFCMEKGLNSNPDTWVTAEDVSFKQWLDQYPADSFYPWQFYGKQYDSIRANSINAVSIGN